MAKNKKEFITRSMQRELAFQLLYELNAKKNTLVNEEADDLEANGPSFDKDAFLIEYFELRELEAKEYPYVSQILDLYLENQEKIEKLLEKNIHGWRVDRVGKTEISIIRLATTEMLFADDVPPAVAINEAVNLAKKYADAKAYKFVNKVLRNIYESINEKTQ